MKEIRKKSEASSTSSYSTSSLSSDDDTEPCDLKPIKDYLFDCKELSRQLFKSVKTEKIRMMLPQALKKMGLTELEEWCASELSGMSRTRILCILNGQKMLESSESSDTEDSGPSLEIISDTEEWLTDDDIPNKEDKLPSESKKLKIKKDKSKNKSKLHNQKGLDKDKLKAKVKGKHKTGDDSNAPEIKIKKEGEKLEKDKEGDSLLDLLELEMRARAIRALIRKEEDIIPTVPTGSASLSNASSSTTKSTSKESSLTSKCIEGKLKEFEMNCAPSEKVDSARGNTADDEDVVLVVQPTPTIELLSSGSEGEDQGTRRNKRLDNERVSHKAQISNVNDKHTNSKNHELNKEESLSNNNIATTADNTQVEISENISKHSNNKNMDIGGNTLNDMVSSETNNPKVVSNNETSVEATTSKEKKLFKKLKKKPRSRVKNKFTNNSIGSSAESKSTEANTVNELSSSASMKLSETTVFIENVKQETVNETSQADGSQKNITNNTPNENHVQNTANILTTDEDKSGDLEEIIDLDDYPDDMDDIECADKNINKTENADKLLNKLEQKKTEDATQVKPSPAETWATRYYQTDDVQSVIKESKIQSEIRKRLRERQRLARLNNSPNSNSLAAIPAPDIQADKLELKTTGSVEEYLALKNTSISANLSSSSSSCSIVATEKDIVPETNVSTENNDKTTTSIKDLVSTTVRSAVNNIKDETNITNKPNTDLLPD